MALVATTTRAQPAADPDGIFTLQDENSSVATGTGLKDKYYVNGLRLNWTSPTDVVWKPAADLSDWVWGPGRNRYAIEVAQLMFTPSNVQQVPPDPKDRPYAGVLTAGYSVIHDSDASRSVLGVQVGVVGPDALAKQMQNGFHSLIGYNGSKGWDYQIHNEPVIELLTNKIWRVPLATFGDFQVDALPEIGAGIGNLRVYGLAGSMFRIGQGLDSDYGVARIHPGPTGTDVYQPTRTFAWYFFAGGDGQVVAHDITIDGNTDQQSASATRKTLVGELQVGLAIILGRARLTYTQVIQTAQIKGQQGGPHQFGSLALSMRF